ncbi:hypothetical protein [Legionella worsleiensis]|uniref:Uncharacterized protein n=1 Tax=Legionella worsleiensis TaxID=45076 RepID=A0A0W1AJS9_9GAMM|nr:hypothetical protein [Legionella worsleiensis]KTD81518.1 hypothetical protein Lwor_0556 [Legionella worsleiensis]STY32077.1 Uncharacterised protein [Legionella worsleiensis]
MLPKLKKIAQRFQDDSHIKKPYTIEEDNLITYPDRSKIKSSEDKIIVVRNVCYLFREGIILNTVDKRFPTFEYTLPNSSIVRAPFVQGSTFFQPGTNRNIIQFSETQSLAIEICADHAGGLLKATRKRNKLLVDYHLILANSTPLKTEHLIGKFNILCDAMTGTSMMQLEAVNKKDVPLVIAITPECHGGLLEYNIEYINPEILITRPRPAVELSDEIHCLTK